MKRVEITSPLIVLLVLVGIIFSIDADARHPFGIIDYRPSSYVESADDPFFYSIGRMLRYGRTISNNSPVLFKARFTDGKLEIVYVSPDNKKAAVVSGGNLYLVDTTGHVSLLLEKVDNYAAHDLKQGDVFYEWPMFQWDASSRAIYIVRNKKQSHISKQTFSHDASLVRIDIDSPTKITEVIRDFASVDYFFVGNDTICFNYAPGNGNVIWKCLHQDKESFVTSHHEKKIFLANGSIIDGKPFVSYWGNIYESAVWLSNYGFSWRRSSDDITDFFSKSNSEKPIFKIQGGYNIKGHYSTGILQTGCKVLPGGRYALLNVRHDKFKGQLLVDRLTGKYRELPVNTRVYLNLNSLNYEHFKFDIGPVTKPEFVPAYNLN